MPARKEYTPELKDQAVRFVLEEIEPDESRKQACERLAPNVSMKAVTLCSWLKQSAPASTHPAALRGTNLSRWTADELEAVAATLNSRPRKTLGWKTPAEALDEYLHSLQQSSVATID